MVGGGVPRTSVCCWLTVSSSVSSGSWLLRRLMERATGRLLSPSQYFPINEVSQSLCGENIQNYPEGKLHIFSCYQCKPTLVIFSHCVWVTHASPCWTNIWEKMQVEKVLHVYLKYTLIGVASCKKKVRRRQIHFSVGCLTDSFEARLHFHDSSALKHICGRFFTLTKLHFHKAQLQVSRDVTHFCKEKSEDLVKCVGEGRGSESNLR